MTCARNLPANLTELLPGVALVEVDVVKLINDAFYIVIGSNISRQSEANTLGVERLVSVVHLSACIFAFSQISLSCFVAAGAVVAPAARLGTGYIVNHSAVINHDAKAGNFSHFAQRACVCGHAKLGQRVLIGCGAVGLSFVVLVDDVVLSAELVATCDLLVPGVHNGIPVVKMN